MKFNYYSGWKLILISTLVEVVSEVELGKINPYFVLNNQYIPLEPPSVEGRRWAGFQGRFYYFLHQLLNNYHSVISLTHQAVQNKFNRLYQ